MEEKVVKYPIGLQDFEGLIKDGYIYVDKTALIYRLINEEKYIFLSRPRRFGKSLLLSTLKAYYEGKKELFKGLAIEKLEKEWKKYPVLYLGLTTYETDNPKSLYSIIDNQFEKWERMYEISNKGPSPSVRFRNIIEAAYEKTGERVVILVDEYDNPLINSLHNKELSDRNREFLKSIYSNLKEMDGYIKFAMLTGVSRFSRMTIFSGLNNLKDISMYTQFGAICGITRDEMVEYFSEGIEKIAEREGTDKEGAELVLKKYYDGYHFTEDCPDIYNPFSLLNAFSEGKLRAYWMQTGTPTFLIKRLIDEKVDLYKIFNSEATDQMLTDSDLSFNSVLPLLFQTGYLTIKDYDARRRRYRLGIPNQEVEEGVFEMLMRCCQYKNTAEGMDIVYNISDALSDGNPEKALLEMKSYLGGIGYPQGHDDKEFAFQNNLLIPLKLLGTDVRNEVRTSYGRIDMVVKTERFVYIFEFKLDASAEEAMKQIKEKEYAMSYSGSGKQVYLVGVNFSSEKRNIDSWLIEPTK